LKACQRANIYHVGFFQVDRQLLYIIVQLRQGAAP